jgi:Ni,Fe-hydrogenase I large subunit
LRAARDAAELAASDVVPLPPADAAVLAEIAGAMDADLDFERTPAWRGAPAETGAIARVASTTAFDTCRAGDRDAAIARCAARLIELARLASAEPPTLSGALPLAAGEGIGWVETARGLLVHRVRLGMDTRIAAYRVVAPTEWNFHPDGAVPRGLAAATFADAAAAARAARWLVQSLDPCVTAHVEVGHA